MTQTQQTQVGTVEESLDDRLIGAAIGTLELFSIHIGRSLGLYQHLAAPVTVESLATGAGIDARYAREWLEQQATAGFVSADSAPDWSRRTYWLSEVQAAVFVVADDPLHVSPLGDMVSGIGKVLGDVVSAYRSGGGVPYALYAKAFRDGQAGINRPAFTHDLPTSWVGAVPDVAERLRKGGRVVDLGCGAGWSTIAMARAFPQAEVVGIDSDAASIADAQANADGEGVDVRFVTLDAVNVELTNSADLILILEALHDMAQPVTVLEKARETLAEGGAVIIADEQVSETFVAPGGELDRLMYGFSVSHCLPAAMAEEESAAIGSVIRPGIVQTLAAQAGFGSFELSDVDGGFFHIYVLRR